jgi:hypothetical protein
MSHETVSINLSSPFPYQAGALFMATLDYPINRKLRDQCFRAICLHEVRKRVWEDATYANNLQPIPPAIFLINPDKVYSILAKGLTERRRRSVATVAVLAPYLAQVEVDGKIVGVKELSEFAAMLIGWSRKSSSNFISKVWVDTRAVAHVALVYTAWLCIHCTLPDFSPDLCPAASFVGQMIKSSEDVRETLLTIKHRQTSQPLFSEEEMIEFLAVDDPLQRL